MMSNEIEDHSVVHNATFTLRTYLQTYYNGWNSCVWHCACLSAQLQDNKLGGDVLNQFIKKPIKYE